MNVVAVIVTFNRKAMLEQTLDAIERQTVRPQAIVLIDNQCTDGTEAMVATLRLTPRLHYVKTERNIGGAGGFKRGMQEAYALGADWLWLMDDDCAPVPDCLEKLLAPLREPDLRDAGFLASRVVWTDGAPCLMNLPVAHPLWIQPHDRHPGLSRVIGSSFVSMLVSRRAIQTVGFPVAEFFIWFDDAEYSRRVSKVMPAYLVTDSVVVHKTPLNHGPLDFTELEDRTLWKFRLGVRNEIAFHLHTGGVLSAARFAARILRRMLLSGTPLRFWPAIASACVAGWFFNYPRHIEFPDGHAPSAPLAVDRHFV